MWGKPTEAGRLIALREKALEVLGTQQPFTSKIQLTLRVHVPRNDRSTGDLDNFVAGVCDGLMKAADGVSAPPPFDESENSAVRPDKTIAIRDDSEVLKIDAEKIVCPGGGYWYEIELAGE